MVDLLTKRHNTCVMKGSADNQINTKTLFITLELNAQLVGFKRNSLKRCLKHWNEVPLHETLIGTLLIFTSIDLQCNTKLVHVRNMAVFREFNETRFPFHLVQK